MCLCVCVSEKLGPWYFKPTKVLFNMVPKFSLRSDIVRTLLPSQHGALRATLGELLLKLDFLKETVFKNLGYAAVIMYFKFVWPKNIVMMKTKCYLDYIAESWHYFPLKIDPISSLGAKTEKKDNLKILMCTYLLRNVYLLNLHLGSVKIRRFPTVAYPEVRASSHGLEA